MKKLLHVFLSFVIVLCFCACGDHSSDITIDESGLYGKWQEGTAFERYYGTPIKRILPNGDTVRVNGTTWDEGDDVTEDEAQLFNWELTGTTLKHEHVGTFVMVPKVYTIILLTTHELAYKDDYGVVHHFSKVE